MHAEILLVSGWSADDITRLVHDRTCPDIILWSTNKTSEYLNACDASRRDLLVKKAMKSRKEVVNLYQRKRREIKQSRLKAWEDRLRDKEAKERLLVTETIRNTEAVMETCGFICKNMEDIDTLIEKHTEDKSKRESLIAQLKYFKCVNRGTVKGSLFFVTSGGKALSIPQLTANLRDIVNQFNAGMLVEEERPMNEVNESTKETSRKELKEKLLAKLNRGVKRKCPFPENDIVGKRIKHVCLAPDGASLVEYHGKVIRKSTQKDIRELMEDEYKSFLEKEYQFYTIIYDPPYDQLFAYPLKKEWDDNLLTVK